MHMSFACIAHVLQLGAYSPDHETIKLFGAVLRDFNEKQKTRSTQICDFM